MIEGEDGGASARLIAINPTLKSQAEQLLPALERAKDAAEDGEIMRVLIRHAPTYAITAKSNAEWAELFGVYLDALAGFSIHAIEDAFLRWNRGEDMKDPAMGQFYPKPAQLVALATKAKNEVWMAAYRARKALEFSEVAAPRKRTDDEVTEVAQGFRDLVETFKAKTIPEDLKPTRTPADVARELRMMATKPVNDVEEPVL